VVVAVTGGARGIGLAIASHLHQQGAIVAIGDVDEAEAIGAAGRLGLRVARRLDVTDHQSFKDFLDFVEEELGPVQVLVNNAGIIAVGSAIDEPDDVTKRVLAVNAYGPILGSKLAAARMRRRGSGHVINIASASGLMPVPGIATYSATKHAIVGFTEAIRLENRASGVSFSAVLPSLTKTQMIDGVGRARGFRNLEPEDVAKTVAELVRRPRPRVVVPRSFGAVALAGRRFMPRPVYELIERALGAERVFQADVDVVRRAAYVERTGTA
jgi:NAD(P)-dependent dehydrogenase (short-subunit alcohol dehydrogenase family)